MSRTAFDAARRRVWVPRIPAGDEQHFLFEQRYANEPRPFVHFVGERKVDLMPLKAVDKHEATLLHDAEHDTREIALGLEKEIASDDVRESVGEAEHNTFALIPAHRGHMAARFLEE